MEVLRGPQIPGFMETNTQGYLSKCLDQVQSCIGPKYCSKEKDTSTFIHKIIITEKKEYIK